MVSGPAVKTVPDRATDRLQHLIEQYRLPEMVFVARPRMPSLDAYAAALKPIWESRWLSNAGPTHAELERRLSEYLGVEHVSLFCNGTIALLVALRPRRLQAGKITPPPFPSPATTHVLFWN